MAATAPRSCSRRWPRPWPAVASARRWCVRTASCPWCSVRGKAVPPRRSACPSRGLRPAVSRCCQPADPGRGTGRPGPPGGEDGLLLTQPTNRFDGVVEGVSLTFTQAHRPGKARCRSPCAGTRRAPASACKASSMPSIPCWAASTASPRAAEATAAVAGRWPVTPPCAASKTGSMPCCAAASGAQPGGVRRQCRPQRQAHAGHQAP